MTGELLVAWGTVLVINLVPAFMPPTWSVVTFFVVHSGLPPLPLAIGCAAASTAGRVALARMSRALGPRTLTGEMRRNLDALAALLSRRGSRLGLGLVFISPVSPFPSNQLFLAAGLAQVSLRVVAPCFFVGRAVEYAAAALAATSAAETIADLVGRHLTSLSGVLLEVFSLVSIVLLVKVPWARLLGATRHGSPGRRP